MHFLLRNTINKLLQKLSSYSIQMIDYIIWKLFGYADKKEDTVMQKSDETKEEYTVIQKSDEIKEEYTVIQKSDETKEIIVSKLEWSVLGEKNSNTESKETNYQDKTIQTDHPNEVCTMTDKKKKYKYRYYKDKKKE